MQHIFQKYFMSILCDRHGGVRLACKISRFDPRPRLTLIEKTDGDSSTVKRSATGVDIPLGDDHYKRMFRITIDVAR